MRIEVVADEHALAPRAADLICDAALAKPDAVFGLPTGTTPLAAYAEIERRVWGRRADFSRASAFAIDEFAGVPWSTPGTNSMFFRRHLRVPWPLHLPDPAAPDPEAEIRAFAGGVRAAGGFDLCVLGIGVNGHIAFNEPGSARDSRARLVSLTPESRAAHAEAFGSLDAVPARGMTLGVADLLEARALLVLAQGDAKAAPVRDALEGAMTAAVPASWLQGHPDILWLLDEAAASRLDSRAPGPAGAARPRAKKR